MQENKICFIICVNDDSQFAECLLYLSRLRVPDGMKMDVLEIREYSSMAQGYQQAMEKSDAKYKVYIHQDVRIVNVNFIEYLVSVFQNDDTIGMVGMVGSPVLPLDMVMWHGERYFDLYYQEIPEDTYNVKNHGYAPVEAIDGYLMATQHDVPWRYDLFDGWHFYDISQSFEHRKAGYQVVVPHTRGAWAIHDEKPCLSLWGYDKYRRIFRDTYYGTGENQ